MNNKKEWNEFLDNMLSNAIAEYKDSEEYKHIKQWLEHIDEMLKTNLTADEKEFVEEILFELGLIAERETEIAYHQGLKDGAWLLKKMKMVA